MVSPRSGEPRAQGELPLSWVLGLGGKPDSDLGILPLPHEPLSHLKPVLVPDHLTGVSAGYSFGCLFTGDSCCDLTADDGPACDL